MKSRLLLVFFLLFAAVPSTAADDPVAVDPEMLEYLGTFQTGKGVPLDPMLFKKDDMDNQIPVNNPGQDKKKSKPKLKNKNQDKGLKDES
jgi:hypothetical protein